MIVSPSSVHAIVSDPGDPKALHHGVYFVAGLADLVVS